MRYGELPEGLELQRTTPTFTDATVPKGLLAAHAVADGVWGLVVVKTGTLGFVFEATPDAVQPLCAGDEQVIPPTVLHHVVADVPVEFAVRFYR